MSDPTLSCDSFTDPSLTAVHRHARSSPSLTAVHRHARSCRAATVATHPNDTRTAAPTPCRNGSFTSGQCPAMTAKPIPSSPEPDQNRRTQPRPASPNPYRAWSDPAVTAMTKSITLHHTTVLASTAKSAPAATRPSRPQADRCRRIHPYRTNPNATGQNRNRRTQPRPASPNPYRASSDPAVTAPPSHDRTHHGSPDITRTEPPSPAPTAFVPNRPQASPP
jgi:hypothetical protein